MATIRLIVKVNWKADDLERLSFASDEKCKVYSQYPSIAVKYYPVGSGSCQKKFQIGFFTRDSFDRCIDSFRSYRATIIDNDSKIKKPVADSKIGDSQSELVCTQQVSDVVRETAINKITQYHRSPSRNEGFESERMVADRSVTSSVLTTPRFSSIPIAASQTYNQAPTNFTINSRNSRRDAEIPRFSKSGYPHDSSHLMNRSYAEPHMSLKNPQIPISSVETGRDSYRYSPPSQNRQASTAHLRRLSITTNPLLNQFHQRQNSNHMASLASPAQLTKKGAHSLSYITHSDNSYTTPTTLHNIRNEHRRWEHPNTQLYQNLSHFNKAATSLGYGFPTPNSVPERQYTTAANYQTTPLQVGSTHSLYQRSHNEDRIPSHRHQILSVIPDRVPVLNKGPVVIDSTHQVLTEDPSRRLFNAASNANSNEILHSQQMHMDHHLKNAKNNQTPAIPILPTQQTPIQTKSSIQPDVPPSTPVSDLRVPPPPSTSTDTSNVSKMDNPGPITFETTKQKRFISNITCNQPTDGPIPVEITTKKRNTPGGDHSDSNSTKKRKKEDLPSNKRTTGCDQSERDDDDDTTLIPNDDSSSSTKTALGLEKLFPDLSDEDLELYISLKLDDKTFLSLLTRVKGIILPDSK
ncbi:unnamed protein product [Ambrosiozyma monospora]|uniref:Unnamed protein product n=1 Tax=Ambrosiozyma monospora TaxID=43982 RepID=A0A9W6YV63_AMBMO|nr:unnamed protein product [Ambrosiozyma monospora]